MPRLAERLAVLKAIFVTRWVRYALPVWTVIATYDTFLSQIIPEHWAQKAPKVWMAAIMTGGLLPVWGWLLILAGLLVVASFEYAFRRVAQHHSPHRELPARPPNQPTAEAPIAKPEIKLKRFIMDIMLERYGIVKYHHYTMCNGGLYKFFSVAYSPRNGSRVQGGLV